MNARAADCNPGQRVRGGENDMDIKDFPTCELVAELKKREGVETHTIGPSASITVKADGPAIVFVVLD